MTSLSYTKFNLDSYRHMLLTALESGYVFKSFDTMNEQGDDRVCLLRHDIDVDMGAALKMAQLESDLGIRSTYFLMNRSPVYNLMSRANQRYAQEIMKLGHFIGLHYDQGFLPGEHMAESKWIDWEVEHLERLLDVNIPVISFHQPSSIVLEGKVDTGKRYNTYTHPKTAGFHYISDSNRVWAKEHPAQVFKNVLYPKLQLLIHPLWWVYGQHDTTEKVWDHAILENLGYMQEQLTTTERAFGGQRKFSIDFDREKS
jgi:hypothetical protein